MSLEKRIICGITTNPKFSWKYKIRQADILGLNKVAFFLTYIEIAERKKIYEVLKKSKIKEIPLVHIRGDFEKWELEFFYENYKTRHFNCHEQTFDYLYKWSGFEKNIYLEYNFDNHIPKIADVSKIAGLCVDLSHFWVAKATGADEYQRTIIDSNKSCVGVNHLGGFSKRISRSLHYIYSLSNFDYLEEIPKKYFSNIIAIELDNSLKQQMFFKKHLINLLEKK
jgi:hypothetical protein